VESKKIPSSTSPAFTPSSFPRSPRDEIIIEKKFNRFWLHFAVGPQTPPNRCKVTVIEKR